MASRSYWTDRGSSERDIHQTRHREGNNRRNYAAYQNEHSSYHSSTRSSASVPHADPTGTFCTLCHDTLYNDYEVQTHLASPQHLDMVVQYPMIPLADVLVPAGSTGEREAYADSGAVAVDELDSSYGSGALNDLKVRGGNSLGR